MSPRWFVVLLAAVLPAAAALPTSAQLATLVQDLNDLAGGGAGSGPAHFQVLGDRLLFIAEAPGSGRELWVTDGTPGGTEMLADACPGECQPDPDPTPLAVIGDLFYFSAASVSGLFSSQLWRTDGSRAGTVPLLDPGIGASYAGPEPAVFFPAVAGSRLLFAATTPEAGTELWSSDGTPEGTGLIADLVPGPESGNPEQLTSLGGEAFFFTREPQHLPGAGSTLWASDGTADGTRRVADLSDPTPDLLTAAAGRLFFVATREARLWVSDGTPGGTRPVEGLSLLRFPYSQYQTYFLLPWRDGVALVVWDEELGAELWASDGTAAGTRRLTDFAFSEPFQEDLQEHEVAAAGELLFFFAREEETGVEPWVTDGTPEGTQMLADVCPGSCSGIETESRLLPLGGAVFFTAREGEGRVQLWRSDGTPQGTVQVSRPCPQGAPGCGQVSREAVVDGKVVFVDLAPDGGFELWQVSASGTGLRRLTRFAPAEPFPRPAGIRSPSWLARLGDRLLFTADDGTHGIELWSREVGAGREANLVADLAPDDPASNPEAVIDLGDGVAFTAFDGRSYGVWTHRGGGTLPATPREPGHPCAADRPAGLTAAGGLIFMICGGQGIQQDLYRTDGTPEGTLRLTDLAGEPGTFIDPRIQAIRGGELFFAATLEGVTAVWRSDGTPEGTGRAFGFAPRPVHSVFSLAWVGEVLYTLTGDNTDGLALWRSDGTEAGTELMATPGLGRFGSLDPFLPLGAAVYFTLYGSSEPGGDLWRTDGTPAGTFPVATFPGLFPRGLTRLGERLYFIAAAGAEAALWESDGTAPGTRPLAALGPAERLPFDSELTRVGSRLFFTAEDPLHGVELWTSDGTAAGTGLARDVAPGPASSFPHGLTAAGEELLLFAAGNGVHGVELWASDEHAAEIRLAHDLAPGSASSSPRELAATFTAGGGRLFFSAQDGLFGRELWSLPLAPRLRDCLAGETALCLGDRFRAEVAWRDGRGRNRQAGAQRLTAHSGAFSFLDPESPELAVKVLDGTGVNGHHWVFFGALTHLQYALTVTDADTGLARRYASPPGRFTAAGDTFAFGSRGASLTGWVPPAEELPAGAPVTAATESGRAAGNGTCAPSETRLCLEDGRFAVEVAWRDFTGRTGAGHATPGRGSSGSFWFFHPANVELVLKLVDGRGVNGRFWLFYGALSNVEHTVTVTDTETGAVKSYFNPAGTFASVGDTRAF